MRRHLRKIWVIALICMIGVTGISINTRAEDQAVFHVQTAEKQNDGTIRVAVYLTGTFNLGGVDVELLYDSRKVTYVSSGLGKTFSDGYGETNCVTDESVIKCVAVFPEAKNAHGELMYAVFRLNSGESYQPEFCVEDILDSSVEIQSIPYTITYQQYDGSWTDTRDSSEKQAEESVIRQARKEYGADEDQNNVENTEENIVEDDSGQGGENKVETASDEDSKKAQKKVAISEKNGNYKRVWIVVGTGILVAIIGMVLWIMRKRRKKR